MLISLSISGLSISFLIRVSIRAYFPTAEKAMSRPREKIVVRAFS